MATGSSRNLVKMFGEQLWLDVGNGEQQMMRYALLMLHSAVRGNMLVFGCSRASEVLVLKGYIWVHNSLAFAIVIF